MDSKPKYNKSTRVVSSSGKVVHINSYGEKPFWNKEHKDWMYETSYGLGNYVQTQDKNKAKRVARKFRSGGVYINGNSADPGTPFGGYRQSGNGREGGKWGLEEYLEVKTICGWK